MPDEDVTQTMNAHLAAMAQRQVEVMSLRDTLAMHAMSGMLSAGKRGGDEDKWNYPSPEAVAVSSYNYADTMLQVRMHTMQQIVTRQAAQAKQNGEASQPEQTTEE